MPVAASSLAIIDVVTIPLLLLLESCYASGVVIIGCCRCYYYLKVTVPVVEMLTHATVCFVGGAGYGWTFHYATRSADTNGVQTIYVPPITVP